MIKRLLFFILVCSSLNINFLFSGTTGKIAGRVVDKETNDPIVAVNIVIVGTNMGAASDLSGNYFINNVPPGTYTLRFMMMGYKKVDVANVRVSVDLTSEVDMVLELTLLEGEVVTVVAERPMVEKDVTAKMAIVSGQDISERMPVTNIQDVLTLQAGFVEGENEGQLYLRGGRSGEVAFYIDGVLVQDPLGGGFGSGIDVNMVQELSVLTGGFNAEYGNAMSGVINITTKEGGPKYSGKIQYESPMLNASAYHQADWLLDTDLVDGLSDQEKLEYYDAIRYYRSPDDSVGVSRYKHVSVLDDPVGKDHTILPMLGQFNLNLSGPVPGIAGMNFFTSAVFSNENSYLPWGFDLDRQVFGKLSYRISPQMKLSFDVQNTWNYAQDYDHSHKYIPPNYNDPNDPLNYNARLLGARALDKNFTDRQTLLLTHTLSQRTFYTLNMQRLFRRSIHNIPGKQVFYDPVTGALDETVPSSYNKLTYLFGTEGEFQGGDDRDWFRSNTTTFNLKFDLTSQVYRNHQIKAGFDVKKHDIFRHAIRDPWFGAFRHRIEYYTRDPWEGALYLQDKMEYDFMILNFGLRVDYARANDTYWEDPGDIQRTVDVTDPDGNVTKVFQFNDRVAAPDRWQISPRIGLAHPVTERLVFHFSYGHFFQNPNYYHLFRNDRSLLNLEESDVILGNPGLKPQKTVAFEVGGKYQISDDIAIDFTGFYKDIRDLTATKFFARQPYDYTMYINEDYGRVKGFDITLTKKYSHYISGNLNYTYGVVKGSGSDPLAGYYYREETAYLRPKKEIFLDFDRTHDLSVNVDLRFPREFGPTFLGTKILASSGLNFLFQLSSGLPYTPSEQGALSLEPNSERKSWINTVDIRLDRSIHFKYLDLVAYVKVTNLFDHLNTQLIWSETGDPWNAGPVNYRTKDRQANPDNVGPRRDIRLGCYVKF
ncbi:TonB-dependent receptor [candidate division KSB1 bacterium]|nr:TonB-dependent receptor [candidate division KSB1 bacterium]